MKKVAALFLLMISTGLLSAQITITSANMPSVDDTVRFSTATMMSASGYDFFVTGANHTWDFSNLTPMSQDVDTFNSVINTSVFYYPSFLSNANLAQKGTTLSFGTFSLTNVYDFYHKNSSHYAQVGFAGTLSGIPLPTVYSSRDYLYRFPLTYGDIDSSDFGYQAGIPGLFSIYNQSQRVNQVDGWGTVTTPLGTFQALRIRSTVTSRDSIASDSIAFPIPPITSTTTEFKWLTHDHPIPVLTASIGGTGTTTVTYIDIYRPIISVAEREAQPSGLVLWPNPGSDMVYVATGTPVFNGEAVGYKLMDVTGRVVKSGEQFQQDGRIHLRVSGLPDGVYFVTLGMPDGTTKSARLLISNL